MNQNSSTDFQIKYPNLSSLIEARGRTSSRSRRAKSGEHVTGTGEGAVRYTGPSERPASKGGQVATGRGSKAARRKAALTGKTPAPGQPGGGETFLQRAKRLGQVGPRTRRGGGLGDPLSPPILAALAQRERKTLRGQKQQKK